MFVLACEGQSSARLRFNIGPCAEFEVPVEIDYTRSFAACDEADWEQEYLAHVHPQQLLHGNPFMLAPATASPFDDDERLGDWRESWFDYAENDNLPESPET